MEHNVIHNFIQHLMKRGDRSQAWILLQQTFQILETQTSQSPEDLLRLAILHANPYIKLKPFSQKGSRSYHILPLTPQEQLHRAIHELILAAKSSPGTTFSHKLARQILLTSSYHPDSLVLRRLKDFHKLAESSRYSS